jgi:hypothetical protein
MTNGNQGSEHDTLRQGSASAVPKTNAARAALPAEGRCFLGGRSFSSDTSRPTQTRALAPEEKRIEKLAPSKFPDENSSRPVPRKIFTTGSTAGKNPCGWLRLAPNATLRYPAVSSSILETPGAPPQRSVRKMPVAAIQPAAANRWAKQVC